MLSKALFFVINKLISSVAALIGVLIVLLPSSPFAFAESIDSTWLQALNWLFPVSTIITHLELWVTAVAAYYIIRVALRWVKAAKS